MESFITANNIPVHINIYGKGSKNVIFLHGFLETMYIWDEFIKKFDNEYKILTIDLPGHGLSGYNKEENSMSFCSGVIADVMDKLELKTATLVGHSMGGYIAIEFSKLYRSKVESLVLINSSPFADSEEKKGDRMREIEIIKENKLMSIANISIPKMFAEENLKKFQNRVEEILAYTEIHDNEGIISSIKGLMTRNDNLNFLKNADFPVLIISGLFDRFMTKERSEYLKKELPNVRFELLSNSGHIAFIEEEEKTKDIITEFLKNCI